MATAGVGGSYKDITHKIPDMVWVDSVIGIAGTVQGTGTPQDPVSNMTDARIIAAARNLHAYHISGTVQLDADISGVSFYGVDILDLHGFTMTDCSTHQIRIGDSVGGGLCDVCDIHECPSVIANFLTSSIIYDSVMSDGSATNLGFDLMRCIMIIGIGLDLTAWLSGSSMNYYDITGELILTNMTIGILNIYANALNLTIDVSCTGGTINVYGVCNITNNGAGVTVNNYTTTSPLSTTQLTTYTQKTAVATAVNGVTWKDLYDGSVITKPTQIWGITLTVAGGWAGLCKYRITDGAGNKIFPFGAECVEGTDFVSGVPVNYPASINIPVASGFKVQFRSSNAGDGAGKTCELTELPVVELG
jgi:hypothetical protein